MPEDVKVTVNPAATSPSPVAPAPAEPTPQVTPEAPAAPVQRTLADAQIAMAEIPVPAPAATPASPATLTGPTQTADEVAQAAQRVKDAQRKMHESTAEASRLRSELNGILNHPMLGPVVKNVMTPGTPVAPADQDVAAAYKQWQAAPNDEQAFQILLATAERRAENKVMNTLNEREVQRVNQARAKQKDAMVAQAINREVAEKANDVPVELFWAMSTRAEMETPVTLLTLPEKLEWQINRSIELAREVINGQATRAVAAQQQSAAVRATAAPVMSPGGVGRSGAPGSAPVKSFVDQVRSTQGRKITS